MSELKSRRYVRKLPDAYKKTVESNNNKLLQIDEAAVDKLYTDISEVVSVLDLDNANGKILDDYGEMLGVYRGELNDRQYRAVIKANIAANISKSDYMSVMRGLDYIFGKGIMSISEVADSIATVRLADTTYDNLRETGLNADQIKELTKKLIAIGVQIEASNFWGTFEFGDILTLGSNTLIGKDVSIPDDDESTFTEIESITLYGKSTQDGTPSPDNPVDIVSVGDSGSVAVTACGKNLFNSTLQTTTINGITCTNNGDGTYTLNGTATEDITRFSLTAPVEIGKTYRFLGCPKDGTGTTYYISENNTWKLDYGKGSKFTANKSTVTLGLTVRTVGTVVTNLVFKPMLTTDLTATYDDFEQYKGSTASITTALPLCGIPVSEGGNYTDKNGQQWICDELIYNADGTGKIVKKIGKIIFDGSEGWDKSGIETIDRYILRKISAIKGVRITSGLCNTYAVDVSETHNEELGKILLYPTYYDQISVNFAEYGTSTVETFKDYLNNNPIVLYTDLIESQEIELTAAEMTALMELQTYSGVTNISNSGGADMTVSYDIKGMEYDEAKGWGNIEQTIGGFFGTVVKGITDVRTRKPLIYVKPTNTRIVYNKPAEITLSSKTYGAKIYYTTDGTDPTDKSTLYTEPFILYSGDYTGVNKTVKAIAYSDDLAPSSISEKVITWKPALIGTFEFSSITPEYDANKGFGNIQQTIGGYVGDVIDNIQWEE